VAPYQSSVDSTVQLVLSTRDGQDSTLETKPPVYLRYVGINTESTPSVLDANGTVRVRDTDGSIVATAEYEEFGCDGGTTTDGSGNELQCLH